MSPSEIRRSLLMNETGFFGLVNVTNTGNVAITLNTTVNGTAGSILSLNTSQMTIASGETRAINVTYVTPEVSVDTNNTGFVKSQIVGDLAQNSSVSEVHVYVEAYVLSYKVNVTKPTSADPRLGVTSGSVTAAVVNVTSPLNVPVSSGVTFTVSLYNSTHNASATVGSPSFNATDSLWYVPFTAPSLSNNRVYSLNVTANNTLAANKVRHDVSEDSIVYSDSIAPLVSIGVPPNLTVNTSFTITVNITEAGGLRSSNFSVAYPNATIQNFNLQYSRQNDLYMFSITLNDTSQVGSYNFTASGCDFSSNCNGTYRTFDILPIVFLSGTARDVEKSAEPASLMEFLLYDKGTTSLRYNITSNSSTGYYNRTIDVRSYDILVTAKDGDFLHSVRINGFNASSNLVDPVLMGEVPNLRTTSSSVKGMYVTTKMNTTNNTVYMDFSDCVSPGCSTSIFNPNNLGIYKYNGNWTTKISSSTNTQWTRLTNPSGGNTDGSINMTSFRASVDVTSLDGVYLLAEFICGDGICSSTFGETSSICSADCAVTSGVPSVNIPSTGGGGGGGGGGGAGTGITTTTTVAEAAQAEEQVPLLVKSELIETELIIGEEKIFSIDITNNLDSASSATLSIEGPVFALLTIQKPSFSIGAKSTTSVNIRAFAPTSAISGIYTGEIVVTVGSNTYRAPVTIKVKDLAEPLLDVKVKALSDAVGPGSLLVYEISLLNMGETAKVEDITVNYTVRSLEDQSRIFFTSSETLAVENINTIRREIRLPDDIPEGKYIIDVAAVYSNGNKFASSADNFEVSTLPLPLLILRSLFLNPITYIVVGGGIPAGLFGYKMFLAYRASKAAKARYVAPLDFKTLPKAGPNSIEVGRIAETNVKAYIDIPQLIMHSIAAGGSGSGKSVSAMVAAEELLKRKVPVIVFDPTAQWTGFMKPNKLKLMLDLYPKFGLKPTDARGFKTNVVIVDDKDMKIELKNYVKPGEITVFVMNRLQPGDLDGFIRRSIQSVFDMRPSESKDIKMLLVYDEVHRLLPKYGGKSGYTAIERAAREFRKWGIGVFLISQVLLDFKGAIRANIANEIQLRTKYEGDIGRVKSKYGIDYASKVTRLTIGTGLFQNPEYNNGRPWFISFRPLLHSPFALTDDELNQYVALNKRIEALDKLVADAKARKVDTYDFEIELNIARDKVKTAAFKMAETYIDSLEKRSEKLKGGAK